MQLLVCIDLLQSKAGHDLSVLRSPSGRQHGLSSDAHAIECVANVSCLTYRFAMQHFIVMLAGRDLYSDVRGKLFESVAHRLLARGDKFTSLDLKTGT